MHGLATVLYTSAHVHCSLSSTCYTSVSFWDHTRTWPSPGTLPTPVCGALCAASLGLSNEWSVCICNTVLSPHWRNNLNRFSKVFWQKLTHHQSSKTTDINNVTWCAQSCLTFCDPTDCSLPGSSVHGIFPAGTLEWVAISSSGESSWPRDWTRISCICKWILSHLENSPDIINKSLLICWLNEYMKKLLKFFDFSECWLCFWKYFIVWNMLRKKY